MNDESRPPGDGRRSDSAENGEHAELLGELARLRRRARAARHAYWFPLVLFGVLSCTALPFYRLTLPGRGSGSLTAVSLGPVPRMPLLGGSPLQGSFFLGYYWLVALVGGYLLCALWYRRHARLAGLQTPARSYVVTGVVLTVAALLLPPLAQFSALRWLAVLWPGDLVLRGTFPFLIIATGLCVLAWAERSRALAVTAACYTGAALLVSLYNASNLLARFGWYGGAAGLWATTLVNVLLPAAVLLAAGAAAGASATRRRRQAAA